MNIEIGQYWRMKSTQNIYYISGLEAWGDPESGWLWVDAEIAQAQYISAVLELLGDNPVFIRTLKEEKSILLENYDLITDEDEIGFLHLQRS